jgi:tetratricopeptide (TPR) repeat protein
MKSRVFHICMGLTFCWPLMAGVVYTQDMRATHNSADTNNAVIEGRVTLPSGFSADRNVKITLKNSQSVLNTLYSNKHGEFQFINLSEGVYYIQAEVDDGNFDPVVEKVSLGRGIVWELTLQLREKKFRHASATGARVISAVEARQPVPEGAKKEYNLGLKFVAKGNFLQAAAHFREALSIYPEYLAARNDLGAQYLKLKRLDEAEEHFRIVLERDPKNFNAKFNFGLVRIERRDYADAISQLNQAMAIDRARPVVHLWLGFTLMEMGDLPNAERELTKALVMGGYDCVAAHYHLAQLYLKRGDPSEALRAVKAYLQESSKGEYAKEARELAKRLEGEMKQQPRQ